MRVVEEIIIDWYDGIVRGFWRLSNEVDRWWYCSMVAFDPGNRHRIYALIPIGAEEVPGRQLIGENPWNWITARESSLIARSEGAATIVHTYDLEGLEHLGEIPIDEVRAELGKDVEAAVEPAAIEQWSRLG